MTRWAKANNMHQRHSEFPTPWQEMSGSGPRKKEVKRHEDWRSTRRLQGKERRKQRRVMKICFRCREPGHTVDDCPANDKNFVWIRMCFRCGSTEHTAKLCKSKKKSGESEFPFTTCYVFGEKGHLASACDENTNDTFPKGGGCYECGSVRHKKIDCPNLMKMNDKSDVMESMSDEDEQQHQKTIPVKKGTFGLCKDLLPESLLEYVSDPATILRAKTLTRLLLDQRRQQGRRERPRSLSPVAEKQNMHEGRKMNIEMGLARHRSQSRGRNRREQWMARRQTRTQARTKVLYHLETSTRSKATFVDVKAPSLQHFSPLTVNQGTVYATPLAVKSQRNGSDYVSEGQLEAAIDRVEKNLLAAIHDGENYETRLQYLRAGCQAIGELPIFTNQLRNATPQQRRLTLFLLGESRFNVDITRKKVPSPETSPDWSLQKFDSPPPLQGTEQRERMSWFPVLGPAYRDEISRGGAKPKQMKTESGREADCPSAKTTDKPLEQGQRVEETTQTVEQNATAIVTVDYVVDKQPPLDEDEEEEEILLLTPEGEESLDEFQDNQKEANVDQEVKLHTPNSAQQQHDKQAAQSAEQWDIRWDARRKYLDVERENEARWASLFTRLAPALSQSGPESLPPWGAAGNKELRTPDEPYFFLGREVVFGSPDVQEAIRGGLMAPVLDAIEQRLAETGDQLEYRWLLREMVSIFEDRRRGDGK